MNRDASASGLMVRLLAPRDTAGLVFFRITLGLVFALEPLYLHFGHQSYDFYIRPTYFFSYPGLGWLPHPSEQGVHAVLAVLFVSGLCIAAGLLYRLAALSYALAFGYLFFLDRSNFHNHYYLMWLLSLLFVVLPANAGYSVDLLWSKSFRRMTVPAWSYGLLRFQIGVVYAFAGIAKLQYDWLHGRPGIFLWLSAVSANPWLKSLDAEMMAMFISIGGLLVDLTVVPLLLYRRTRGIGFLITLAFHLSNAILFRGKGAHVWLFPWLMIPATTIFFEPNWPRRMWSRVRRKRFEPLPIREFPAAPASGPARLALATALAVFMILQLGIPMRHWIYPGNPAWTEEGSDFSWRMMSRMKHGMARIELTDSSTGEIFEHDPATLLTVRQIGALSGNPSLMAQYARHLSEKYASRGRPGIQVHYFTQVSLNGRPPQPLVDPTIDFARISPSRRDDSWIKPLEGDLPPLKDTMNSLMARFGNLSQD